MNNKKAVETLNDLLTRNYDAEEGFKQSAEKVDDLTLKAYLERRAQNRYDFGHELKEAIKQHGGEVDKGTSLMGDMHRVWINLKDALTSGDKAIYDECVRGEKAFIEEYQEAITNSDVPTTLHPMLKKQLDSSRAAVKELEAMEAFK